MQVENVITKKTISKNFQKHYVIHSDK